MVNNQNEFNKEYSDKKVSEIEFKRSKSFQGQLVIEDYSELKTLSLRDNKSIEQVILKNLSELQECTIWNCNTEDLVIENCPQLKELNICKNSLTNLEFLKDLENLEELKIDGNAKLNKILEPYEGDWKTYQKDLKKANKNTNTLELLENIQTLKKENEFLNIKYDELKKFLKGILVSFSQEEKKGLSVELNKKINRKDSISAPGRTKELKLNTEKIVKSWKEIRKELESELVESKTKIEDLQKELAEKVALQQETKRELETQKITTEALLKQLVAKTVEKEKASNENEANDLQKAINDLRQKLKESEKEVAKLEGKLEAKGEDIELMSKTIEKAIDTPKVQNINTVYGIQSINTYNTQCNNYYQQLANKTEKEISEPLTNLQVTEQDKQVINQTIIFWGVQELFFNYRKNTIDKLVNYYCQLANKTKVTKKWTTRINSVMGITSKLAASVPSGGVAETPLGIVGDIAVLTGVILEDKYLDKCIEEFKEIISKDSKDLNFFDQSYDSLAKTIWSNNEPLSPATTKIVETLKLVREKPYPFSKDQDIYQISDIRQEHFADLDSEQLKNFLEKLDTNLVEVCQSFEDQKKQLNEQEWFKAIDQQTDLLQEQKVEAQIQVDPNIKAF